jgi:predicted  nucleic acid-binding Zn-ribbon protein
LAALSKKNKIDEAKSSHLDITRKVSSLEITVKELKEKTKDIENSTQVMSDLFEDVKHNCSSNKTEIDTLKRRFEEVDNVRRFSSTSAGNCFLIPK